MTLAWLYPRIGHEQAAEAILRQNDMRLVVATLGARGAFGVSSGARVHDHSKLDRDLQLAPGELEDALRFACLVAAITCARAGAEPPFRAEIERHAPGSS